MKRFLFLTMLAFIAGMVYVSVHKKEDNTSLPQKMEQAMRLTKMMAYQDDDYDYIVRYPGFFEQTDDSSLNRRTIRSWKKAVAVSASGETTLRLSKRLLWKTMPTV